MKKILMAATIGLSTLVGGVMGNSIGYNRGVADQAAKQIRAIRVESTNHPLSLDDSLRIHIETEDGRQYTCDDSMPRDQSAPCIYNFNPGIGFVGRDAYTGSSSVGGDINDDNL